ncbi:IS5 family transposase [Coraliomargarita algicola]|uniref:IS5 family transposase n=1 Tax=Coraliomargarita algicola TaxID=3092156 RepID=A0ABZ0RQD4_9BACT|nr:IS5 family transposase [Coraliomargarita sp. J2-16]WPJ95134.1 IS5 family transposase [Coraliomargarita sp. J2-16]
MKPKTRSAESAQFFQHDLEHLLDQRQPLYKLANQLPWNELEEAFESYYSQIGRPALPTRLMARLLLLRQLENLSDERVCAAWARDPYMQYFCGGRYLQWKLPCEPSELVHFRNRIGGESVEKIFKMTVELHADKVANKEELVADTTVQEANIKFPTDTRLHADCIEKLWRMGEAEEVSWRRSYVRTVPTLLARLRTRSNRLVKERRKCRRKIKTIAGRLLRDFKRNVGSCGELLYAEELALIKRVLRQKRHDKNKVYSRHDPQVLCIAKGKAHKKYEFGRKASVTMLRDSGVIVSAVSFKENLYDGDTLEPALEQASSMTGKTFESVLVDKGYRGRKNVSGTEVVIPEKISKKLSAYHRRKQRKRNGRRAVIEPVIGHLKSDYRMARCFLKGALGAELNLGLAAAAWNLKKWINELLLALILWREHNLQSCNLHLQNKFYSAL